MISVTLRCASRVQTVVSVFGAMEKVGTSGRPNEFVHSEVDVTMGPEKLRPSVTLCQRSGVPELAWTPVSRAKAINARVAALVMLGILVFGPGLFTGDAMFGTLPCYAQDEPAAAAPSGKPSVADIKFDPEKPVTGDKIGISMTLTNAARAEIRWFLGEEEIALSDYDGLAGPVRLDRPIKTGETLLARVTPYDESGVAGKTVAKRIICAAASPTIKLVTQKLEGTHYTAKVEAKHPDQDAMTLSIEGPEGMKIDQDGNITWDSGKITNQRVNIKVIAKDTRNAEAILTYSIGIRREEKR